MQNKQIELPGKPPLSGNETLWRYMSLSRLLSMIKGSAFIPTLATLQNIDRNESKLTTQCCSDSPAVRSCLANDEENRKWLLDQVSLQERKELEARRPSGPYEALDHQRAFEHLWLHELALRRCVWCWFEGQNESMAQWSVYSREGVAIRSDVDSVLNALSHTDVAASCVYGRIDYIDRNQPRNLSDNMHLAWHPYFAKQGSFKHEQEVRFVFRNDLAEDPGRHVFIDFSKLVKEIVISPYLPDEEATAVMHAIKQLLPPEPRIHVSVSAEQSGSQFRRTDQTFNERWQETFRWPYEDESFPPCLMTDMPTTELENLSSESV